MPNEEEDPDPEPGGESPSAVEDDLLHPQVLIADLLAGDPNAARVLDQEFGLPCYRCPARWVETLESGITYSEIPAARVLDRLRALRSLAGETQVVGEVAPEASPSPSEDPS